MAAPAGETRFSSKHVDLVLDRVDRLPTLSPIAMRVLSLGSADEVDIDQVVELLESDPALTTMILGLCRRADRAMNSRITTVKRAVVMLGMDAVRSAVLSVSVYELIRAESDEVDRLGKAGDGGAPRVDRAGLWKHAVAVACCSELLAEQHRTLGVKPEEAFIAGLLHDLGRLVLELVLPKAVARVSELAERRGCNSAAIERQLIGIDHHTAGRRVAMRWGLPAPLQDVMWRHGQPFSTLPEESNRALIGLVTMAKAYCQQQHLGWSGDFGEPPAPEKLAEEMKLPADSCSRVLGELIPAVVDRCTLLRLDEQTDLELLLQSVSSANRRLSQLNTQLREQARSAEARTRALEAIAAFEDQEAAPRRISGAVEQIGRSIAGQLGKGFYALLVRPWDGESWRVHLLSPSGRVDRSEVVEASAATPRVITLAGVSRGEGRPVGSLGADAWLVELLARVNPPAEARVLPLLMAQAPEDAVAILVHDRGGQWLWRDTAVVMALTGVWAGRLRGAAAAERADRDGERVAEVSRELAAAQAKLTEVQSLARLGELTAGAAHEMNTPLAVVRGRAEMLLGRLDPGSSEHGDARSIAAAATDIAGIITDLHDLSMPPARRVSVWPLDAGLRDAVAHAADRSEGAGPVEFRGATDSAVRADRELVTRALAEVLCNAFEAAPGQTVVVTAQADRADGRLLLRVVDRGAGFSERALRHAFDPFFSEKAAGRRRGLGLARARRLLELNGGTISAGPSPAGGGSVTVTLPLEAALVVPLRAAG